VLIATGLLMFGFVAYQLWGTGIQYAQAQNGLEDEFADVLAGAPATTATTATTAPAPTTVDGPVSTAPTSIEPATTEPATPDPPPIDEGDAIARLEAPAIGLDTIVVAGVSTDDLRRGPGHYPDTPLPGQLGNSAIAGHRTTYGQPFFDVDNLQPDDEIVVTTVTGRYTYRVTGTQIVSPDDSQVIATTDPTVATLTLTSCDPKYTARDRIIVSATLDRTGSPAPRPATPSYARDDEPVTSAPTTVTTLAGDDEPTGTTVAAPVPDTVPEALDEAFDQGWFDDDGAWPQVALWGLALTATSVGAYLLSRKARTNWAGGLVGLVPFVVCLYFFFENVNRLLPAAL
jgi:sortase A